MMDDPTITGPLIWSITLVLILVFFIFLGRAELRRSAREKRAAEEAAGLATRDQACDDGA